MISCNAVDRYHSMRGVAFQRTARHEANLREIISFLQHPLKMNIDLRTCDKILCSVGRICRHASVPVTYVCKLYHVHTHSFKSMNVYSTREKTTTRTTTTNLRFKFPESELN